jgi:hypothetical protein
MSVTGGVWAVQLRPSTPSSRSPDEPEHRRGGKGRCMSQLALHHSVHYRLRKHAPGTGGDAPQLFCCRALAAAAVAFTDGQTQVRLPTCPLQGVSTVKLMLTEHKLLFPDHHCPVLALNTRRRMSAVGKPKLGRCCWMMAEIWLTPVDTCA